MSESNYSSNYSSDYSSSSYQQNYKPTNKSPTNQEISLNNSPSLNMPPTYQTNSSGLNSIINIQIKGMTNQDEILQLRKTFNIIYITLKRQSIQKYLSKFPLIPSTQSREELLKKYSLFSQTYYIMSRTLIRQYVDYVSSDFRSQFKSTELVNSVTNKVWWLTALSLYLYSSRRKSYKWISLTISPRPVFLFRSFGGLYLLSALGHTVYKHKIQTCIQKNICEFDSIVKTQQFILNSFISNKRQDSQQTTPQEQEKLSYTYANMDINEQKNIV